MDAYHIAALVWLVVVAIAFVLVFTALKHLSTGLKFMTVLGTALVGAVAIGGITMLIQTRSSHQKKKLY